MDMWFGHTSNVKDCGLRESIDKWIRGYGHTSGLNAVVTGVNAVVIGVDAVVIDVVV